MWRGFFRFGGRTDPTEFRRAFGADALVALTLWALGSLFARVAYYAQMGASSSADWASFAVMDACEKISSVALLASLGADALFAFYCLAAFVPTLALTCRRLRDAGKSPARVLFALIPVVGPILLLVWLCGSSRDDESVPAAGV